MKAGGQRGGYAHDDSEVDVLGVFSSRGILQGLDGPGGVLRPAARQFLRHGLEEAYEPAARGEDEGHPEDQVMRVIWDEDDVAFELDFPDMMDMVYKWEGQPVLLVDPEMNRDFGDMILDVVAQDGEFNFFMTEVDSSN